MKKKNQDILLKFFYAVSALLVLAGALFKLQHFPNGDLMLFAGFISGSIISSVEINRLKRKIKELEKA